MLKSKKLKIIIILAALLGIVSMGLVSFIRRNYVPPILMYHFIRPGEPPSMRLTVSPATFERQMRVLKILRYKVRPLSDLVKMMESSEKIPYGTVFITFDDGSKDNYINAYPVLKKYSLPATMFIITQEVGRDDRLNWNEILKMRDSGLIDFGSHCIGPEPLVNLKSEEKIKDEIFRSKAVLEDKLNEPIELFAYPEGLFNERIRQLVIDAGYKLAFTTSKKGYPDNDRFAMKRLRISETSANPIVFCIQVSGVYNFIKEHRDD
ncbi:MAG: polysaccharide deacetylase family protein [Candidatus Omnitrophota bacterium]|jgi:peptidoglycan/xylan/chitin deacetylase (PgdA/CDA1 family)|nr:MAG: polysaccharide deacetylase family protein [Candidatus Omnitrophota bacterium]